MKNLFFLLVFLFSTATINLQANTIPNTTPINKIIKSNPVKKVNSKADKKNNSFLLWSNPYKLSTFCRLIQLGNYEAVKSLIESGENVNKESNKLTPLMYAARHNRVEILQLLIDSGANLKAKSNKGYTALDWAKMSDAKEAYIVLQTALKKQKK